MDGGGTLTAVLRRVEMRERVIPPSHSHLFTFAPIIPQSSSPPPEHQHKLIATHNHPVHPLSGKPSSPSTILSSIRATFSTSPEDELSIDDLWLSNGLDAACGGMTRALIDALLLPPSNIDASATTPSAGDDDSTSTYIPRDEPTSSTLTIAAVPPELEWELTQGNPADTLTWLVKWTTWTPPSLSSSSLTASNSRPYAAWGSDAGTKWENDDEDEGEYISLAQARREMDDGDGDDDGGSWTLKDSEMEMMSKASDLWASWGNSETTEAGEAGGGWEEATNAKGDWGESSPLGIAEVKGLPVEGEGD